MRQFKTWRDPHGAGYSTCRLKNIQIESGLTVLVGCNGAGKTTLLHNIEESLYNDDIPFKMFNNLADGGGFNVGNALFNDDLGLAAGLMTASEGEAINIRISQLSYNLRDFIKIGIYSTGDRLEKIKWAFEDYLGCDQKEVGSNERWLLFDATDSGYSIDNVVELKQLFKLMIEDGEKFGVDVYIVISANEYELARDVQCFDVQKGKYLTFKDYDEYRKFILKSRELKDSRIERAAERQDQNEWRRNHGEL